MVPEPIRRVLAPPLAPLRLVQPRVTRHKDAFQELRSEVLCVIRMQRAVRVFYGRSEPHARYGELTCPRCGQHLRRNVEERSTHCCDQCGARSYHFRVPAGLLYRRVNSSMNPFHNGVRFPPRAGIRGAVKIVAKAIRQAVTAQYDTCPRCGRGVAVVREPMLTVKNWSCQRHLRLAVMPCGRILLRRHVDAERVR